MSAHFPCTCPGTRKERIRNWYIPTGYKNTNYSWFESPKGQAHYSEYSTVKCSKCFMNIRSKAKYVSKLPVKNIY